MPEQTRRRILRRSSPPPRFQVFTKCCDDACGQRQNSGLEELRLPNGDRADLQIDVTKTQTRDLAYAQPGAVTDSQHRIKSERAQRCAPRWIGASDVQQKPDLFRAIDVGPTPLASEPPPRKRVWPRHWNAGIEMAPGPGQGAPQQFTISGVEGRRTCSRPMLQHDLHRLLGELRVPLQKTVEPQEHASFRVVAESPRAHERNVIAHQIAKNAAKPGQLPQRFQRLVRLRGKEARRIVSLPITQHWCAARRRDCWQSILPARGSRGIDLQCRHGGEPWKLTTPRFVRSQTSSHLLTRDDEHSPRFTTSWKPRSTWR